jgi:hypothetical protein
MRPVTPGTVDDVDRRVVRVRRRIVLTPVRTYQQRETGRTITLIGTFHLGEPGYYRAMERVIADLETVAAITMLKAENAPDGVLLWGAAHLPGISAHLTTDGFRCIKTEWLAVGRVPAMIPSLRIVRPIETIRAIRRRRR